jgi:hypothetical protein
MSCLQVWRPFDEYLSTLSTQFVQGSEKPNWRSIRLHDWLSTPRNWECRVYISLNVCRAWWRTKSGPKIRSVYMTCFNIAYNKWKQWRDDATKERIFRLHVYMHVKYWCKSFRHWHRQPDRPRVTICLLLVSAANISNLDILHNFNSSFSRPTFVS